MIYLTNLSNDINLTIQPSLRNCECSSDVYPYLKGVNEPYTRITYGEHIDL